MVMRCWGLLLLAAACAVPGPSLARSTADAHYGGSPLTPCPECNLLVGFGGTFKYFDWTDGIVIPITLEIDESRWELGAFRFARGQYLKEPSLLPLSVRGAQPYWGFTAMRRWQVLHRRWGRLYLGFGANYKNETDYLDSTYWNFAYLIAVRFDVGRSGLVELAVRHWSNAWFRMPNRGQNFATVSFSF